MPFAGILKLVQAKNSHDVWVVRRGMEPFHCCNELFQSSNATFCAKCSKRKVEIVERRDGVSLLEELHALDEK